MKNKLNDCRLEEVKTSWAAAMEARWGKFKYVLQGPAISMSCTCKQGMKTYADWKKDHEG